MLLPKKSIKLINQSKKSYKNVKDVKIEMNYLKIFARQKIIKKI